MRQDRGPFVRAADHLLLQRASKAARLAVDVDPGQSVIASEAAFLDPGQCPSRDLRHLKLGQMAVGRQRGQAESRRRRTDGGLSFSRLSSDHDGFDLHNGNSA